MKKKIQKHFQGDFQAFYGKYLQNIKALNGEEFQARCPFHEDKHPSFSFNNKTGQYYCHGCGKKGDFIHFYAKINGLDTRRDFGKVLRGIAKDFAIPWDEPKSKLVETYDYTDEQGNLLYQVCRYSPKSFKQRRPGEKGKWVWNLRGVRPVLFNLPALQGAEEILLTEGERDALNLGDLGFTATCNPGGAGKWKPEYSDVLKGKNIVLCPDMDRPGREGMAKVGAALVDHVASLKWLDLPDLPSGGDVSDFIAKFSDPEEAKERLALLVENAEPYDPPRPKTLEDVILPAGAFLQVELPEKKTLLHPWLSEQTISLISGWRGVGKSWFALSVLGAVSRGKPFGPWEGGEPVPCLFLDGEMVSQDVIERLNDLGIDSEAPLFVYSDSYANHLGLPRANLLNESWRSAMLRILKTRRVKLWVVDNIGAMTPGADENIKKDWDPVNEWLLSLRFAGISTILLHHTGKGGEQRGTSAREDSIDTSIILKAPFDYTPEDGARFVVHFKKSRVRTKDLKTLADMEFKLTQNESGNLAWTWGSVKGQTKRDVLRLIDEDVRPTDISQMLGITRGRVSQIQAEARKENFITPKGKLTQSGHRFAYGNN